MEWFNLREQKPTRLNNWVQKLTKETKWDILKCNSLEWKKNYRS